MSECLRVHELVAGYGEGVVLDRISFRVKEGESLAILGRNGVGKTTLIETLMGTTHLHGGSIFVGGRDITHYPSHARVAAGLGWVPQEREVFPSLTVEENLTVAARPGNWTLKRLFDLFPRLAERRRNYGNQLSGGEQQMLAIGRALSSNPHVLLLDEPMEGLAPIIVEELSRTIVELSTSGEITCLVVEQHPIVALSLSRNAIILERGRIVHTALSEELAGDRAALERLLGLGRKETAASVSGAAIIKCNREQRGHR
jgi:branched-chain amino acid transport system ATP-binding protein